MTHRILKIYLFNINKCILELKKQNNSNPALWTGRALLLLNIYKNSFKYFYFHNDRIPDKFLDINNVLSFHFLEFLISKFENNDSVRSFYSALPGSGQINSGQLNNQTITGFNYILMATGLLKQIDNIFNSILKEESMDISNQFKTSNIDNKKLRL